MAPRALRRLAIFLVPVLLALGAPGPGTSPRQVPPRPETRVTLVAVGDLLLHQDVKRAAREHPLGFRGLWEEVQPLFDQADLVFGNLETPVAPTTGRPGQPFVFNAPGELPFDLKASGFEVLAAANNHAFDQGARGLRETLDRLEALGLTPVGGGRDRSGAEAARILERRGLRIAFLAYTDVVNADLNHRDEAPWVGRLDLVAAVAAVRAARSRADVVVVSLHWGQEYEHQPTFRQRQAALRLVGAGADLLLGHHPHVLQPLERVEAEGHSGIVIYSLGNFISNQDRVYDPGSMPVAAGDDRDGVALVATFRKTGEHTELERLSVEPLWTENNWARFTSGLDSRREIRVVRAAEGEGVRSLRRRRIEEILNGKVYPKNQPLGAGLASPRITPSTRPQTAASPI